MIEERQSSAEKLLVLSLGMVILSGGILFYGKFRSKWVYIGIGIIGIATFLYSLIYWYRRVLTAKPLIIIKSEGIVDSSSSTSIGFIAFHEIKSFEIVNIFGQEMIGIHLNNIERFIQTLPRMKQKAIRTNVKMKMPAILLRVERAKDMTIEDIYTLLEKRLMDVSCLYF